MRSIVKPLLGLAVVAGLAAGAYFTRDVWRPWLDKAKGGDAKAAPKEDAAGHGGERVKLSPQAQANLKLVVEPLVPETYSRTLLIPGMVVDRPGLSDRGVITQVAGVVTEIKIQPGDTVKSGEPLFTVRLLSELFQNSQSELFKATRNIQLNQENLARLKAIDEKAIAQSRVIELENEDRRLRATASAYRQELLTRGLKPEQIDAAAEGKFVTEITVLAPARPADPKQPVTSQAPQGSAAQVPTIAFEVKDLKVQLGEQVQAGQVLSTLADHRLLYIEGRAFKQEAGQLEKAAQSGWPVKAEFAEESNGWPANQEGLKIRHLANSVDPVSRTFAFYLPLENQSRAYQKDGQTFLVWRFRPGQRVRLRVPVEQVENVFVLPTEAVVREGAETYVFRQNGDFFERKPVHVLMEERETVVLADDGSVGAGQFVARNGATAINRAIKGQAAGGGDHGHSHAH